MTRVGIFIGVDRTGQLPVLQDAARSATLVAKRWASEYGIESAGVFTDAGGAAVTAASILQTVDQVVQRGDVDQLFIYFAGHGVNLRMNEYWLLSGAPRYPQEAVNVRGSADLARYCGIPHVVFFSDACRTAADTIQAQSVTGSEIFPNDQISDGKPVDLFYACALGRPAHEIRDVELTASEFKAIYTHELLAAPNAPGVTEWKGEPHNQIGYIRPRPLRDYMKLAVARRIRALHLQTSVIQIPDALITSDPDACLFMKRGGASPSLVMRAGARQDMAAASPEVSVRPEVAARDIARGVLDLALQYPDGADLALGSPSAFGPLHYETQCGFKVRGARLTNARARGVTVQCVGPTGELVRIAGVQKPGVDVLLELESGAGFVLPAIPDFIAALTVDDGEVVDVSYEPSDNTERWQAYKFAARELTTLRRAIATATRAGVCRIEGEGALTLARRLQQLKGVDPTLAVYAAYAYNDLQRVDLIEQMSRYLTDDLGAPIFDVAMMARPVGRDSDARRTLGFAPLLSQGWAYLPARRFRLPKGLEGLPSMLTGSLWTMFDERGVALLKQTIFEGVPPWQQVD